MDINRLMRQARKHSRPVPLSEAERKDAQRVAQEADRSYRERMTHRIGFQPGYQRLEYDGSAFYLWAEDKTTLLWSGLSKEEGCRRHEAMQSTRLL